MTEDRDLYTEAIDLSGIGDAVRGEVRLANGGNENAWGLSSGLGARIWIRDGNALPYGTLLVVDGSGAAKSTTAGSKRVVGVIADPEGSQPYANAWVQMAGYAVVLATGTIVTGDLVRSSATAGTCEKATDLSNAFGIALSDSQGGYVTVAIGIGSTMTPDNWPSHHVLSHLADGDDHHQYWRRAEVAPGPDRLIGATVTAWNSEDSGVHNPVNPANVNDGNDATYSRLVDDTFANAYEGWRFDLGTAKTLNYFTILAYLPSGLTIAGWRVRTSTDGTSWNDLDSGTFDLPYWDPTLSVLQAHGHQAATSQHWEFALLLNGIELGGYVKTLTWRLAPGGLDTSMGGGGSPNLDGGEAASTYGGITAIDCGGA